MPRDASELSRMLAADILLVVAELLPAGNREGAEWRVGSLAGEPGKSLAVHLGGPRSGIWSDFASGDRGDALDLVAAVLYRGDRRSAIGWARRRFGLLDDRAPTAQHRPAPGLPPRNLQADVEIAARRRSAQRLFLAAEPTIAGTPAALYLAARGIDLAELGRQPRSLRFHPALPNRESGRAWPALVAAIVDADGSHAATHRTWLAQGDDGRWTKAPLANAKMALGPLAGGAIRLWRGQSGRQLAQAPVGETVAIAEGIETALSVVVACPHLRVLAAVSLSNMGRISLPPTVETVVLAADNDSGNPVAQRALAQAIRHYQAEGREVRVAIPPTPGTDWNDVLIAGAS